MIGTSTSLWSTCLEGNSSRICGNDGGLKTKLPASMLLKYVFMLVVGAARFSRCKIYLCHAYR